MVGMTASLSCLNVDVFEAAGGDSNRRISCASEEAEANLDQCCSEKIHTVDVRDRSSTSSLRGQSATPLEIRENRETTFDNIYETSRIVFVVGSGIH